nr:MAG TPA: hypothetical protein [Caudoviricetes sp.]
MWVIESDSHSQWGWGFASRYPVMAEGRFRDPFCIFLSISPIPFVLLFADFYTFPKKY